MTALEDFEISRAEAFFRRVTGRYAAERGVSALVITHLLGERPAFLRAVGRMAEVAAVLPKPKSIDPAAMEEITGQMPVDELDRAAFADPGHALAYLESRAAGQPVVLLDVGGYFAPSLADLCGRFSGQVVGVVEDTENGHQRYEALGASLGKLPCPVFSVARSPLKDPEDYLVGQSVTFSAEALIRSRGDILQGRPAAVIGYGKLGRSIAAMLHARHVGATVFDSDPVQRTQAMSQGFRTASTLAQAIAGAGLIVCATGNLALREDDFARVANGAYIASVTSSDDELELEALDGLYVRTASGPHVTRYARTGHFFYLLADGNAVNFLHGASVGAFIFLVQAEILAALGTLAAVGAGPGSLEPGLHELDATERSLIAATWLRYFDGTP
ncbi:adenosylhomocysteinase [Actinomadura fulvescens]|uniref:Adenosylhomocysteinase n=1 Tax=Actinomadura fulvescens TaxID=46160 RepID=A0ABN3QYK1_9ACTN